MKERLTKRFEDILKADCGNRRAIRQIALINHAKITTIDSFCSYILKNYYNTIGYEPSYRIADKGETELIKEDVYNELLEERLKNNDENLITAINSLTQGKSIAPFLILLKNSMMPQKATLGLRNGFLTVQNYMTLIMRRN